MDKYKIELQKDGKWAVFTRDYFWQRWKPMGWTDDRKYTTIREDGPKTFPTIEDALRFIGSAWWKKFYVRVDSIGVF